MSRFLAASDRSSLIRLASSLPAGSPERKALLAGLNKKSSFLTPELVEAAQLGNAKDFADLVFEGHEEDSQSVLDDIFGSGELRAALGGEDPHSFRKAVDRILGSLISDRVDSAINSSPWKKELLALSDVLGESAVPKKVRRIKYQPKMVRGAVVGVWVEGVGSDDWEYAGTRTLLNASDAMKNRTTLDQVIACLQALGAKSATRAPSRKPLTTPLYD